MDKTMNKEFDKDIGVIKDNILWILEQFAWQNLETLYNNQHNIADNSLSLYEARHTTWLTAHNISFEMSFEDGIIARCLFFDEDEECIGTDYKNSVAIRNNHIQVIWIISSNGFIIDDAHLIIDYDYVTKPTLSLFAPDAHQERAKFKEFMAMWRLKG